MLIPHITHVLQMGCGVHGVRKVCVIRELRHALGEAWWCHSKWKEWKGIFIFVESSCNIFVKV
jgi:hypothetical protein